MHCLCDLANATTFCCGEYNDWSGNPPPLLLIEQQRINNYWKDAFYEAFQIYIMMGWLFTSFVVLSKDYLCDGCERQPIIFLKYGCL